MAKTDQNLADRSGGLVESHKGYDPRIVFFYFVIAAMLATLVAGLGYQQLHRLDWHADRERQQTQRRILIPGPRGNIYDRNGVLLVTNSPRWTVVLHLDELQREFYREQDQILKNYRRMKLDDKDIPNLTQRKQIARVSVAQRYLDQVNRVLHRQLTVDSHALQTHFTRELLLPFTLVDGLDDAEYARLLERLPVNSPVQVYATNIRNYPFGSAAAHALGYVRPEVDVEAEDFPDEDLKTFPMKGGTTGKAGLELSFDKQLQGQAGGKILLVDPAGYRIRKPLKEQKPRQGEKVVTSLDIDLQLVAEQNLARSENIGSAVALDVATGEVLVIANKPDYDLNSFYPRLAPEIYKKIQDEGAEFFPGLNGQYPPGSTFKILVSMAGLRSGRLLPDDTSVDCVGEIFLGRTRKTCDNGHAHHGHVNLPQAIAKSCDIYFYRHGIDLGPDLIAEEARRFHLDRPTGIELPYETKGMLIPDRAWKKQKFGQPWTDGDTANIAIGQGALLVTPLSMACFAASVARNETYTKPTLLHDPNRPPQHTEPTGLTPGQYGVLLEGMKGVISMPGGTGYAALNLPDQRIPGVQVAAKTGTAEYGPKGDLNIAWFICFAPAEKPEIAVAVAIRSDTPGEEYGGGRNAGPVAMAILRKYFEKKTNPRKELVSPFKSRGK